MSEIKPQEQAPIDLDKMTPEEEKMFKKYGRLPKQSQLLAKKDKKYFDSADWAKGVKSGMEPKLPKSPPS